MKKQDAKKKKRISTDERIDAILKHPFVVKKIELKRQLKERNNN
jgi:phage pi2 protein 07